MSLLHRGDFVGQSSMYMTDRHLLDGAEAEAASRLDEYLSKTTYTGKI
jgi:hypothetical protein